MWWMAVVLTVLKALHVGRLAVYLLESVGTVSSHVTDRLVR